MDHQHPERSRSSGLADRSGADGVWERPAPGRRTLTAQLQAKPAASTAGLLPAAATAAYTPAEDPAELNALFDAAVRPDLPASPALQRKLAVGTDAAATAAPPPQLGEGAPLPDDVRGSMEHAFGADFSTVRVRESSDASAMGARAFARGDDLCFAPGQFDPASTGGRELIGHELAHVVQQRAGRVSASTAQGDAGIVADPALEAEADELGAHAARGEVVANSNAAGSQGGTAIQRAINCTDPGTNTAGWQMAQWGNWLDNRGITWGDLVGTGVIVAPVVHPLANPPAANRVRSLAHHELLALQRDVNVHAFGTLAAVHTEVARRAAATVMSMVNAGVAPDDLDMALDMYGRLDGTGPGSVAVLHKLDWHDSHDVQYARRNVEQAVATQQGLVYGPWRNGANQPSDGRGGGANVHTMPLNVVWLMACAHHGVSLRLFAPPTERGLFREGGVNGAGDVNNATTGAPQRKLSALARELIALVGTGLYTVTPEQDNGAPAGFQDTWLLTPTAAAFDANMAQLSSNNNDYDLPQLTALLQPRGITVIQPGSAGDTAVTNTSGDLKRWTAQLKKYAPQQMGNWTQIRANLVSQAEQRIVAITGESVMAMRRRVLGTINATFQCQYVTRPGQRLYVVGSIDELGGWNAGQAVPLTYAGDHWLAPVSVSKYQRLLYKYLLEDDTGRHWEVGNNHVRNTDADSTYQDNWGGG